MLRANHGTAVANTTATATIVDRLRNEGPGARSLGPARGVTSERSRRLVATTTPAAVTTVTTTSGTVDSHPNVPSVCAIPSTSAIAMMASASSATAPVHSGTND